MASTYQQLKAVLASEPRFRLGQVHQAWFDPAIGGYGDITTLPLVLREKLNAFPWLSVATHTALKSALDDTEKLLLKLEDSQYVEMVIMGRSTPRVGGETRQRYTICVSSQAGCPMRCAFCATGKQGFKRNLSAQEIVDQYRFANRRLAERGERVANMVFMGQGEPLLNYDNVKEALNILLAYTDLGETKITVSTAGVVPAMEKVIYDDFPPVRWAVSLHSAIEESRKKIMPSHRPGFLDFLVDWSQKYHARFPSRTHFIGLEYIMLGGVNDDERHLEALIAMARRMPQVRINLIPYNSISDAPIDNISIFSRSSPATIDRWHDRLMKSGFTVTVRYSQGQDIAAACGQLSNKTTVSA